MRSGSAGRGNADAAHTLMRGARAGWCWRGAAAGGTQSHTRSWLARWRVPFGFPRATASHQRDTDETRRIGRRLACSPWTQGCTPHTSPWPGRTRSSLEGPYRAGGQAGPAGAGQHTRGAWFPSCAAPGHTTRRPRWSEQPVLLVTRRLRPIAPFGMRADLPRR